MLDKYLVSVKRCGRFSSCSAHICPIDPDANLIDAVEGESICPFTIKKKSKEQKGIKTLARDSVLEVIPESNLKMLNNRNQKAWLRLHENGKR